jgi:hypothetical protein
VPAAADAARRRARRTGARSAATTCCGRARQRAAARTRTRTRTRTDRSAHACTHTHTHKPTHTRARARTPTRTHTYTHMCRQGRGGDGRKREGERGGRGKREGGTELAVLGYSDPWYPSCSILQISCPSCMLRRYARCPKGNTIARAVSMGNLIMSIAETCPHGLSCDTKLMMTTVVQLCCHISGTERAASIHINHSCVIIRNMQHSRQCQHPQHCAKPCMTVGAKSTTLINSEDRQMLIRRILNQRISNNNKRAT